MDLSKLLITFKDFFELMSTQFYYNEITFNLTASYIKQ